MEEDRRDDLENHQSNSQNNGKEEAYLVYHPRTPLTQPPPLTLSITHPTFSPSSNRPPSLSKISTHSPISKHSSALTQSTSSISFLTLSTILRLVSTHVSMTAFSFSIACCAAKRRGNIFNGVVRLERPLSRD